MKNFKKLLFITTLSLGAASCQTVTSECPETKECEKCETTASSQTNEVVYDNGLPITDNTIHLLCNETEQVLANSSKKIKINGISTSSLTFKSSDESVASVTSSGVITALKSNKNCKITISSSGFSKEIRVNTYSMDNYFLVSSGAITGCVDPDIEELVIPNGYTSITNSKFRNRKRLKKMVFPEGFVSIKEEAGTNPLPYSLEYLSLPSTFKSFSSGERLITPNLKQFIVSEENPYFKVYDNKFIYSTDQLDTNPTSKNCVFKFLEGFDGNITQEMIDETGIKYLGNYSALNVSSLENVTIPTGLTPNKYFSFAHSKNLKTVSLPKSFLDYYTHSSATTYYEYVSRMFARCENLEEFKIYDGDSKEVTNESNSYIVHDGNLYFKANSALSLVKGVKNGLIHDSCTTIGGMAYLGNKIDNSHFKVPTRVTRVKANAFLYSTINRIWVDRSQTEFVMPTATYNSTADDASGYLYLYLDDGCNELNLDTLTNVATESKFVPFFRNGNPNLKIYDGNVYDATIRFRLTGYGYSEYDYAHISEEDYMLL